MKRLQTSGNRCAILSGLRFFSFILLLDSEQSVITWFLAYGFTCTSGSFQICRLLATCRYHATRLWLFLCRRFPITTLSTSQSNIILFIEMSFGKGIIIGKNNCFVMCIFFSFISVCNYSGWTLVILFIH